MKKIMKHAAVLCCAITMSLTSCSQYDNPSDPSTKPVTMADVVTLNTAPQSFYKLDTKEMLPIYVAVNSAYKDARGNTKFYDLSKVKEVNVSVTNDMFIVDASHLAENGYIKLTPDPDNSEIKSMIDIVENYGVYKISGGFTVELINDKGEKLVSDLDYTYLAKNEQKEVLSIKQSDLDENGFFEAEITADGKLVVTTDGLTTTPDEPDTLTLEFTRSLTGSPHPMLPEGDGLMVNFRYELELNISE